MARMRGAVWKPLLRGFTTAMARYDVVVIHTCVGSLAGTDAYFRSGNTSSNSHFGTGGYGEIWQWGDTARRSAANGAGNHRSITIENADMGPGFPAWNTRDGSAVPAFTPQQLEANARICAWAHITHGVPLVAADTSRPSARGVGYHRLGCDYWRVPDGELWSSSVGKVCPGPRRIAQIPQIIARAIEIVNGDDDMPLNDEDLRRIDRLVDDRLRPIYDTLTPGKEGIKFDGQMYAWARDTAARAAALQETVKTLAVANGTDIDVDALMARVDATVREAMADKVHVEVSVVDGDPASVRAT